MVEGISGSSPIQPHKQLGSSDPGAIKNGCWYPTYRTTPGQVPPIPDGVNEVNLFVGELDGTAGVTGLEGAFSDPKILAAFIKECHAHNPPIEVMVSIGGHGGAYDNTWSQLTSGNIAQYAKALKTFCTSNGIAGIDFDYEPTTFTPAQAALVGQLIGQFKSSSGLETSLCVNAGITPWQAQALAVFQAATVNGKCGIDHLNIMAYYPIATVKADLLSWKAWVQQFGLSPSQITVGMDPAATDPGGGTTGLDAFAQFCKDEGFSSGDWSWDPANAAASNKDSDEIWNIFHPKVHQQKRKDK